MSKVKRRLDPKFWLYNMRLDADGLKTAPAGQARRSALKITLKYIRT